MDSDKYNPEKDPDTTLEKKTVSKSTDKTVDKTRVEKSEKDDKNTEKKAKRAAFFVAKKDEEYAEKKADESETKEEKLPDGQESDVHEVLLSEDELHDAVEHIVDTRENQLAEELQITEPESPEELAAVANAVFLASVREKLQESDEFTEDAIEAAYEQAAADLELESSEGTEAAPEVIIEDTQLPDTPEPPDSAPPSQSVIPPSMSPPPHSPPQPPTAGGGTPPSPPPPPLPPHPPQPPTYPPLQPQSSPKVGVAPRVAAINQTPAQHNSQPRRRRNDLLIGAVVGYVIGRRGGRMRTEKKLVPKIDKLEREVAQLHDAIAEREHRIRVRAVTTARMEGTKTSRTLAEKSPSIVHERLVMLSNKKQERADRHKNELKNERLKSTAIPEKIGAMKLTKIELFMERRLIDGTEVDPKRKPVEIMTIPELKEKIGGLEIDGLKVAAAYESGQIDEHTLREVTKRYLRSGDYERVFRYERKASHDELREKVRKVESLQSFRDAQLSDNHPLATVRTQQQNLDTGVSDTASNDSIQLEKQYQRSAIPKAHKLVKPWIGVVIGIAVAVLLLLIQG